jgi:hypothetical protein
MLSNFHAEKSQNRRTGSGAPHHCQRDRTRASWGRYVVSWLCCELMINIPFDSFNYLNQWVAADVDRSVAFLER